ncbi:hypothetical protein AAU61_21290 [Desulfocarbo indianensis]|nr:hypothetical protein AAU61_21290 [Desulfocarbo indianensis]
MHGDLLLSPLEAIKPQEILARYSDWIYFALVLIFFIAVAGIALRRHFERPYVRPLIVVVGLMLTLAVFRNRRVLGLIFEGWGTVGSILLVLVVAVIPFGLARGFGLSKSRAFWLTFALFYLLAWAHFPGCFAALSAHGLGLLNLVLLVLFIVSLWRIFRFNFRGKSASPETLHEWASETQHRPEMEREEQLEEREARAVKKEAIPITIGELRSIEDIEEALVKIQGVIKRHPQSLERDDRQRIATLLQAALNKEGLFKANAEKLKKVIQRLGAVDRNQLQEKKNRLRGIKGKEKELLKAEIKREEERIVIEGTIAELESRLGNNIQNFDKQIAAVIEALRSSAYTGDALPFLERGKRTLRDIRTITLALKDLEPRLVSLLKEERRLLAKERQAA